MTKNKSRSNVAEVKAESQLDTSKEIIYEYHKIEINEILARVRGQTSLRAQFYSFLGTAHLVILGLAFTNQKVTILVMAIIPLLALMVIDQGLRRAEAAIELRGLELEDKYSPDPENSLLHTLIAVYHTNSYWVEKLNDINRIKEFSEKRRVLRRTSPGLPSALVIPVLIAIEITIAANLYYAGWKLF